MATPAVPAGVFTKCRVAGCNWINVATLAVPAGVFTMCRVAGCKRLAVRTLAVPAGVFTLCRVAGCNWIKAVSYTHLDVYKRQILLLCASLTLHNSFIYL